MDNLKTSRREAESQGDFEIHRGYRHGRLHGKRQQWYRNGGKYPDTWWIYGKLITEREYLLLVSRVVNNIVKKVEIARAVGLSLPRFKKCIQSLKSRAFCEWWYSPTGIGGRRTKRLLAGWLEKF
jgi:DNA invertase Pin-like site-specific DNA recombinase